MSDQESSNAASADSAARALFEALFARGPFAVVVVGSDGRIERANAGFAQLLGYFPAQLTGRPVQELTHPEDLPRDSEFLRRLASGEEGYRSRLKRYLHRAGEVVWAETTSLIIRIPGGASKGIAFLTDVTARRAMEEALRRSNERFETMARATRDLVYEWDILEGTITWNDVITSRYGHADGVETRSLHWWEEQLHPQDRERVINDLTLALERPEEAWSCEYRFRNARGGYFDIFDRGLFLRDGRGSATRMIGVMVDVTELHAAHAQLRLADRLASLGTLAAGVAHEINNPLSWVVNNLAVARAATQHLIGTADVNDEGRRLIDSLRDAEDGVRRVTGIVRDLKMFARPDEDVRGPVSLERVLEGTLSVAHNDLRYRARVVRDYAPVPPVLGNEARLAQVFLNMILNAAQALPEGRPDQNEIRVSLRRAADGRIEAAVKDTGPGIATEALEQIFDPFFTTKPPGVGTGLGLAICHRIVVSLGGEIQVETAPKKGTTFRVLLPPAAGAEPVPVSVPPPPAQPVRRARVLVLDDEPLVGRALRRSLDRHEVQLAGTATEVLSRVASGEKWDLILCDVMMPDMSGMEFFEALRAVSPAQCEKVAFMTGGAFTQRAQSFFASVQNPRLEKPFDGAAVEAVLASLGGSSVA